MIRSTWLILVISALFLLTCALVFIPFLAYHEPMADRLLWRFDDPFYDWLPAKDLSIPIFSITYGSLLIFLILEYTSPLKIGKLMVAYAFVILLRIVSMTLVPLKESIDVIDLTDPFLNELIYPSKIDSDLFFSGHTALLLLLFFISKRVLFLVLACFLGLFLMIQRIHYSIDIFGAIPFAYLA
jgi:hypothetical protein